MSTGEGQNAVELRTFLAPHAPVATEHVAWADGTVPIQIAYYVTDETPPEAYVTSVRAVVTSAEGILVLRNLDAVHALPGGRREPGETFEATLRREILEETGLSIGDPRPLGIVHLHHLGPAPRDYAYPFPDFLWAVFAASAAPRAPVSVNDPYELEAGFEPVDRALERIDLGSRIYVSAAIRSEGPAKR